MPPKVSVIIPCHNYAHFLPEATNSVLGQSFSDFEIIIIDDASTDNSVEVMQSFADPRIRLVFHKENKGCLATFNEGVGMAAGKYICILSADDKYKPNFLKRTVEILDKHPEAGLAYTGWEVVTHDGRFGRFPPLPHAEDGIYDELPHLVLQNFIAHCTVLVRATVQREVGSYIYSYSGDWDMWLRIAHRHPLAFVKESLYQYRRHGTNMSVNSKALLATGTQDAAILDRVFADPELPPPVRRLERRAKAIQRWRAGRMQIQARSWRSGVRQVASAIATDFRVLFSIRRIGALGASLLMGISGRAWSGW